MSQVQLHSPARGEFFSLERWGYFLAAAVLAGCSSALVYRNTAYQSYSEPIVGSLSWAFATKVNDYAVLYAFVALFFAFLWALKALGSRLERSSAGSEAGFHDLVVMLCVPAGLWAAGLLTTREVSLQLLFLSGILLVAGVALRAILGVRKEASIRADAVPLVQKMLLFVALGAMAYLAVASAIVRVDGISGSAYWISSRTGQVGAMGCGVVALLAAVLLACRGRSSAGMARLLDRAIVGLQFALPAAFLQLVSQPWVVDGHLVIGYHFSTWAWVFIGACMALSWFDITRRALRLRGNPSVAPTELLAISSLVAILFFLKAQPGDVPMVWPDDYHFGELLVPWWSMVQHHLIPFWDYTPARGLVNYMFGAVLSIFLDGKVASYAATGGFFFVALLFLALPVLARVFGRGIAFLALFFFPYLNGLNEIDLVVTVFLFGMCMGFFKWRPAIWLCLWVALGTLLVLFAPGQGALAVLATAPMGFVRAYRMKQGDREGWKVLAGFLAVFALVALATPLGKMVFGAVRYGYEQSSVNSIAHGVWWSAGFGKAPTNPWLFDLMRTLWVMTALWAGVAIWKSRRDPDPAVRKRVLVYALPILILSILFIVRAVGRIDSDGTMSRLGAASMWSVTLLLPILIFTIGQVRNFGVALFLWLAIVGAVHINFGGVKFDYAGRFDPVVDPRGAPDWSAGASTVPKAGSGIVDAGHIARLVALRKVLDTVLAPQETYFDISGRHATYYYFDRRPPVEAGSIYNLVTQAQQLRAIASLRREPPPLVLIEADNITHDGGPASLRSPLVYRHLLLSQRYKVAVIGRQTWLVDASRVGRLAGLDVKSISEVSDLPDSPLHAIFAAPDLQYIPASWGRSFDTLQAGLTRIGTVAPQELSGSNAVQPLPSGEFQVLGSDPWVRYSLARMKLAGSDAGMLAFDFHCTERPGGPPPVVEIFWSTSTNPESEGTAARMRAVDGRLLVPLDAYPSWLLAKSVRSLRFDVQDARSCSAYGVSNIALYQRAAAERVGPAAAGVAPQ